MKLRGGATNSLFCVLYELLSQYQCFYKMEVHNKRILFLFFRWMSVGHIVAENEKFGTVVGYKITLSCFIRRVGDGIFLCILYSVYCDDDGI
jgi:hypothetical protein